MMLKSIKGLGASAAVTALCVFSTCCGGEDERQFILDLMGTIGHRVKERDVPGLMELLDEGYADFEQRDKAQTEKMIRDYFRDYRGIVVHFLATRIDFLEGGEASAKTEVVISSGAAEVFRKLFKAFGDFYRFDIHLRKTGEAWLVRYAEWENVGLSDLSSESLSQLKKIFPGL